MRAKFIRNLVLFFAVLFAAHGLYAQDASRIYIEPTGWSLGVDGGPSDMWGDVGTDKVLDHYANSKYTDKICFMGGVFGRYTIHPAFALRAMANYGTIYATDKWNYDLAKKSTTQGDFAYQRYARAQDAKDIMFEGTLLLEVTPLRLNPESNIAHKRLQPFLAAGFSYFHFTPYSTVGTTGKFVATYDLHLEGQGFGPGYPPAYSLWQPAVPLALGVRLDVGQHFNIGIEYMYRITFFDYLDGVSGKYIDPDAYAVHLNAKDAATAALVADKGYQYNYELPNGKGNLRGNATNNDAYSSLNITIYYKLLGKSHEWWHKY